MEDGMVVGVKIFEFEQGSLFFRVKEERFDLGGLVWGLLLPIFL